MELTLQTKDGKPVIMSGEQYGSKVEFWEKDGDQMTKVDEAIIVKGNDTFPSKEYVHKQFVDAGFGHILYALDYEARGYRSFVQIQTKHDYERPHNFFTLNQNRGKEIFTAGGYHVSKEDFNKILELASRISKFTFLVETWGHQLSKVKGNQTTQTVLEMIGVGQTITPASLKKMCAKDEDRARFLPGETVEVAIRKQKVMASVISIGTKVSVLRSDGKKGNYAYAACNRVDGGVGFDEDILKDLDPTIKAAFDDILANSKRLYKAQITRQNITIPIFPDDNEQAEKYEDVPTCECPLCGWPMAEHSVYGKKSPIPEYHCSYCRARGLVAHQGSKDVTLLMLRQPAKNSFCLSEARCCGNCGLFGFEYGRQGKRSTGYCSVTNQCVQAHTTCVTADDPGYWFPRAPESYSQNIKQHVTNLGYGVEDRRNTDRNDIRDTIYREDDHKAERKRADHAKIVYSAAFSKFMVQMGTMGDGRHAMSDELSDEAKEKVRKHFRRILD